MNFHSPSFLVSLLTLAGLHLLSANAQAADAKKTTATAAVAVVPQLNAMLRVLKTDASTVLGQSLVTPGAAVGVINLRQADALVAANGRCAFNVKLEEVSNVAAAGTTTRLYSNDALVAQVGKIDLQAGVGKTFITQPYLVPGVNNLRVVMNADAAQPRTGWVRIHVDGTCTATPPKPVTPPTPVTPPAPPKPVVIAPGSGDWNALYNAWGYSNYATTQLKGKNFAKYADVVKLNADLGAVVKAQRVEQPAYAALMARWNALANDAAFKAVMATVVPAGGGK